MEKNDQDTVLQQRGVKLAEEILQAMVNYGKDVQGQASEISEGKAMFFAAYFTLLAVGRSEAYRMMEEAKLAGLPGITLRSLVETNVDLALRGSNILQSGFTQTCVHDFKLNQQVFEKAMVEFTRALAGTVEQVKQQMVKKAPGSQGNDDGNGGGITWH